MNEPNVHMAWASVLLKSLAEAGVSEFVVSPGSRSGPLVLAAAALAHRGIRLHTVVDERSAAFFALGQAKMTGRPSLLISTSGTAAAHYFPAVIEAGASYTPLLVLTADRPPELHDSAANQTIDQAKLFGRHARHYTELGLPDSRPEALRALRRKAAQAVLMSHHPIPGAVHLNAWLRKPLEPQSGHDEADQALAEHVQRVCGAPLVRSYPPSMVPDPAAVAELARACIATRRGLILCGPGPVSQGHARAAIEAFAGATGFPLLAEGASQVRFVGGTSSTGSASGTGGTGAARVTRVDGFDALFHSPAFRRRFPPELLIQIGAPPISDGWRLYVEDYPQCPRFVIAPYGWNDPQSSATVLILGDVDLAAGELARALEGRASPEASSWQRGFAAGDDIVWQVIAEELRGREGQLTGGSIARAVLEGIPPRSTLAVGNSLPIREVDAFCPGSLARVSVWSQRGVSGIDGVVSGAAGAASVAHGPVTLLVGDLGFLHDLGGLALARQLARPLVIVVVQNDGGRIFEELPIADHPELQAALEEYFIAPHGLDFSHAAWLFGHRYHRVDSAGSLRETLTRSYDAAGCTVIEAVVPPHSEAAQHRRLRAAVAERLERESWREFP